MAFEILQGDNIIEFFSCSLAMPLAPLARIFPLGGGSMCLELDCSGPLFTIQSSYSHLGREVILLSLKSFRITENVHGPTHQGAQHFKFFLFGILR